MANRFRYVLGKGIWRYILSFSFIIIFVIMAMGLYLYNYYSNTIYHDFVVSNEEYLSKVADRHENDVKFINNISMQTVLSDTVTPFLLEEQPEKSSVIQRQLKQYKGVNQFFNQVYLIFHNDHYLYNESTSVELDRFRNSGLILETTSSQTVEELLYNSKEIRVLPEQGVSGSFALRDLGEGEKAVLYFVPIQYGKLGSLLFVTGSTYYDNLLNRPEEECRASYIIKDNQIIARRGGAFFDNTYIEELLTNRGETECFTVRGKDGKYLIGVSQGEHGFQYCTVQSMEIYKDKMLNGQWPLLFFILLCTIPAAILTMILSKRLNHAIGNIKALLQRDSGKGNDFAAIESGILELMGNNTRLSEIAQKSLGARRSEMIRSFVRGTYTTREAVVDAGSQVGLNLDKDYYKVALMGSRDNEDGKNAKEILLNLLEEDESTEGYGLELISHEQLLFVIFSDTEEALEDVIRRLEAMGRGLYKNLAISVSNQHMEFGEISVAYLEANTAYDNRFLVGNSSILRFSDVILGTPVSSIPDMYMGNLKYAVKAGDERAIDSAINAVCTYLQSGEQSLFNFRKLYNEIIHMLIHEWNPENIEFQEIYNIFALSECLSIQDFNDVLKEVCVILLGNRSEAIENPNDKMQHAAAYMRENYSDSNLNMNSLADYLGVSAVTLSVEFKEAFGMSPSDYLILLRIERAKELLLTTNLSVTEISGAVGYFDVPGFIRRFKKHIGKTPAQFRKSS